MQAPTSYLCMCVCIRTFPKHCSGVRERLFGVRSVRCSAFRTFGLLFRLFCFVRQRFCFAQGCVLLERPHGVFGSDVLFGKFASELFCSIASFVETPLFCSAALFGHSYCRMLCSVVLFGYFVIFHCRPRMAISNHLFGILLRCFAWIFCSVVLLSLFPICSWRSWVVLLGRFVRRLSPY
jgi:hypothetical protein